MTTDTQNTPIKEEQDALMAAHTVAQVMGECGDRQFFQALENLLCGAWGSGAWGDGTYLTRKKRAQKAINLLEDYVGEE